MVDNDVEVGCNCCRNSLEDGDHSSSNCCMLSRGNILGSSLFSALQVMATANQGCSAVRHHPTSIQQKYSCIRKAGKLESMHDEQSHRRSERLPTSCSRYRILNFGTSHGPTLNACLVRASGCLLLQSIIDRKAQNPPVLQIKILSGEFVNKGIIRI